MDHKKVIKQTLYDFVEKKVKEQKAEVRKEIESKITAAIDPILKDWIQVKQIEKDASLLADRLTELAELHPYAVSWDVKNVARSLNRTIFTLSTDMRKLILDDVREYVYHPSRGKVEMTSQSLEVAILRLQKEAVPLIKKINDLATLQGELRLVIANEANGPRAYRALVALGVDLSEITEASPNLPAIVKLSVDPGLLS
ncbi:hypothetical protein J7E73_02395 [Paenibacillus albidus]|uniref:hypothetical protein n=1 Tax=Paenibacillus albidus TaxID=2041023 RepID=UPI001BEA08F5|nr:hypothetical protein [Paenibacillus albidus]MBT2287996.1 hypothetical protein [Paenibacillus albidus]